MKRFIFGMLLMGAVSLFADREDRVTQLEYQMKQVGCARMSQK